MTPRTRTTPLHTPHRRVLFVPGAAGQQSVAGVAARDDVAGAPAPEGHDALTKASLARALAELLAVDFAGCADAQAAASPAYVVPAQTLALDEARALGIGGEDDLFGGVVPRPFVGTKTITHPLVAPDARAPAGWNADFPRRVADVVLDGFSAFDASDARRACERLLRDGAVRVKDAAGVGGVGQAVVRDLREFDALLDARAFADPWAGGLVLERNLNQVCTASVGQLRVGGWVLSYHGTQRLVRNHRGDEVYGGSTLHVVRGDFDALLRETDTPQPLRLAVMQARAYHEAALQCFDGLLASRANYDVAQGVDDTGAWRSGVLEQSWRIGGASGAEVAALRALLDRPEARWVQASTHEVYDGQAPPRDAQVHFDGVDAQVGRLLKYACVDAVGE